MEKIKATGVVLVGGRSSRMGSNKALLEFEGKPLLARTLEVLDEVFAEVLISSNDPSLYHGFGYPVVTDIIADKGPLGGLHAVLKASSYDYAFLAACDMPFITEEGIRWLAEKRDDYELIVPFALSRVHPLFAFYRQSLLPKVEDYLRCDRLRIAELIADCDSKIVRINREIDQKIFLNVNTPQEWESAQTAVKD